jgi:hypothetical protein
LSGALANDVLSLCLPYEHLLTARQNDFSFSAAPFSIPLSTADQEPLALGHRAPASRPAMARSGSVGSQTFNAAERLSDPSREEVMPGRYQDTGSFIPFGGGR